MGNYSIKDLENFTQIKAHTLRIWEQRYGLLNPERTDTNIRYYSDKDLKKILNVNLLYKNGIKISKIASMSDQQIFDKATELMGDPQKTASDEVDILIEHIMELDEPAIHKELDDLTKEVGLDQLYPQYIIPLLERVGELWQVNTLTVSHEHFISNIIREFFVVKIEEIKNRLKSKGKVVLFLPEHEKHELSLLYYYYILKKRGYECYYLGQSVPMSDFLNFINVVKPDYVVTSLISEISERHLTSILDNLLDLIPADHLFIGGYQAKKLKKFIPPKVNSIQRFEDLTL